jgi:hypothetical protein
VEINNLDTCCEQVGRRGQDYAYRFKFRVLLNGILMTKAEENFSLKFFFS